MGGSGLQLQKVLSEAGEYIRHVEGRIRGLHDELMAVKGRLNFYEKIAMRVSALDFNKLALRMRIFGERRREHIFHWDFFIGVGLVTL